jgi:hypothetical protein
MSKRALEHAMSASVLPDSGSDRPTLESAPVSGISPAVAGSGPADETNPTLLVGVPEPLADTPLPAAVRVSLEVLRSADGKRSITLWKTRTVIGRGAEADLCIHDAKASRKHASIFFNGTEFRVRDESSLNGTLLNGSRVMEYAIRDGDELLVGDTLVCFRRSE